jgi:hypothetical protein
MRWFALVALAGCAPRHSGPQPDGAPAKIELRGPHGELQLGFAADEKRPELEQGPAGWKLADRYRITAPAPGYLDILTPDGVPLLRGAPDPDGGETAHDAGGLPFLRAARDGARIVLTARDGTILGSVHHTSSLLAALVLGDDAIDGDDRVAIALFVLHHSR